MTAEADVTQPFRPSTGLEEEQMRLKPILWLSCLSICSVSSLSANATSAIELAAACRALLSDVQRDGSTVQYKANYQSGLCLGAFRVMHTVTNLRGEDGKPLLRVCYPAGVKFTSTISVFVKYVEATPQDGETDGSLVALNSLALAYPCK